MGKRVLTDYRRAYLSVAVSVARRRVKERAVAYKGGACTRCGFKGRAVAFDFHHVESSRKDFKISGSHTSFERIKRELDKTILLCANCHRELHDEEDQAALDARVEALASRPKPPRGGAAHR